MEAKEFWSINADMRDAVLEEGICSILTSIPIQMPQQVVDIAKEAYLLGYYNAMTEYDTTEDGFFRSLPDDYFVRE